MAATQPARPWPAWLDRLLVIAFIIAIASPGLIMIARPHSAERKQQYRTMKKQLRESHSVVETVGALKTWFETTFAFRDKLIEARALVRVKGLGVSTSKLVVMGKNDWLFYAGEQSVESFRHLRPLSASELDDWKLVIDAWVARAKAVGAPLIVMFPPDKSTVYPELMPSWATIAKKPSRLDQLAGLLSQRTDLDFIDMRPIFREMRKQSSLPLYYKTDTHWNMLGSYVAARELATVLAKHFPAVVVPPPVTDASLVRLHERGGDLARFLGLAQLDDEDVTFTEPPATATVAGTSDLAMRDMHYERAMSSTRPNAAIPRGLIYRDSFSTAMIKRMAEHFGSALYIWSGTVDAKQVEAFKPDVVVVEFVERTLAQHHSLGEGM